MLYALSLGLFLGSCGDSGQGEPTAAADSIVPLELTAVDYEPPTLERVKNMTIYEVNVRQYSEKGDFASFIEHIPRLKMMGVDILWIMPIHPIGVKNRKGGMGSYYAVQDYKAVNPEFGTLDDLKALVNKAHELGMYVILDWVANHTAWDGPWIENHPEWFTQDAQGNVVVPEGTDWTDVADLNYDVPEMRAAMIDALTYWVKEADIDGYRCDVAGMVPTDFWVEARKALDEVKPVFMLAEWGTPEVHAAFDMSYGWDFHHILNEVAQAKKGPKDIQLYFATNEAAFVDSVKDLPYGDFRMQFTSNHDENSWNGTEFERMGDAYPAMAVLTYTLPGMPLIYSGQEAGLDKRLSFFEKDTIDFSTTLYADFYTKLNTLKENNPAIWSGSFGGSLEFLKTDKDAQILAFVREKDGNQVLVIMNLSKQSAAFSIDSPAIEGEWEDVFFTEGDVFAKKQEFNLDPWKYMVYRR